MLRRFLEHDGAGGGASRGAHLPLRALQTSALKRLVGRYGVGTEELDPLLPRQVFVDLHRIVKQAVRVRGGVLHQDAGAALGFVRAVPLEEASPARAAWSWPSPWGSWTTRRSSDRPVVGGYNKDDCVSTRALRDWLEELRAQAIAEARDLPTRAPEVKPDVEEAAAEPGAMDDAAGGRAGRGGRALTRAARPLARRAPHRMAPPRGQERLVGVLPPAGSLGG